MQVRSRSLVTVRTEDFGASAYVSDRDDIFLLDSRSSQLIQRLGSRWVAVSPSDRLTALRLAELGIIEARVKSTGLVIGQRSYSGVHLVGDFPDVPLVKAPLLLNCFSTSWCPLKCVYCHADDLMTAEIRSSETAVSVDRVAQTAATFPALVYVITGGDPLSRPDRALRLSERIRPDAGVVIDTSGVGKVADAIRLLKARPMHLRVSIDSMDPRINRKTRPINVALKEELDFGDDHSLDLATRLIEEAGPYASGVTVQTVVSAKNDKAEHLMQFRDWLLSRGVGNWVLHFAINAGAARRFSVRSAQEKRKLSEIGARSLAGTKTVTILPDRDTASRAVREVIESSLDSMDIRCTDALGMPNSVFLVGSEGALYTQGRGPDGGRKVKIFDYADVPAVSPWTYVGCLDHVLRYINFVPSIHGMTPVGVKLGG